MRLLIDTHSFLWFCEGSPNLSKAARAAMEDDANERYISHATVWEVAIKLSLGKLELQADFREVFSNVLEANGFILLEPTVAHYEMLTRLPRHHGDPFDRLMIPQALVEDMAVVTCDGYFASYGISLVW